MYTEDRTFDDLFKKDEKAPSVIEEQQVLSDSDKNDCPHVSRGFAITVISVFVSLLLLPTLVWGCLKVANIFEPSIMETLDFDTGENRAFAEFPTSFNPKTITKDIEAWYNDNLPFRSILFKTQVTIDTLFERPYDNSLRPMLIRLFYGEESQTSPSGGDALKLDNKIDIPQMFEDVPIYDNDEEAYADCNHQITTEIVTIKEPTCADWGIVGYPCSKCEYVHKQYTQKKPHEYISTTSEFPICGAHYEDVLKCTVCEHTYTYTTQKRHTQGNVIKTVKPTLDDYGYTLIKCSDCGYEYRRDFYDKLYNTNPFPIQSKNDAIIGRNNWLFLQTDAKYSFYRGTNLMTDSELKEHAEVFQTLNNICEEKDILLQITYWPNKEEVYPEYMPTLAVTNEYKRTERLVDYVKQNTNVRIIYPLEELIAAKPYCELYLPLDTHWNRAGAFVGYQAMLKSLGLQTTDISDVPIKVTTDGGDDLARKLGLSKNDFAPQKNYNILYRPHVEYIFDRGDVGSVNATTYTRSNGTYDMNFVMLGDSFRLMQRDYIKKDFTDCTLAHKNNVKSPEVRSAIKKANIIVIASVERGDASALSAAKELISILSE